MVLALSLIAAASAVHAACGPRQAVHVDERTVAAATEQWLGRCVRLDGYVAGRVFYSDVAGWYSFWARDADDRRNNGWLGLYFIDQHENVARVRRATIVGELHDCGRDWEIEHASAGPNVLVMSIGYCHQNGGLVLHQVVVSADRPATFTRRTGTEARLRYGDLLAATAGRRPPPEVSSLVIRFLHSLRRGDLPQLRSQVEPWDENLDPGSSAEQRWNSSLLGDTHAGLHRLRVSTGAVPTVFFEERRSRSYLEDQIPPQWHACFCTVRDCSGRWPISAVDASADRRRPYVCLVAFNLEGGEAPPNRLGISFHDRGWREPIG